MKKFISNWQGLFCGIAAFLLFLLHGPIIERLSPNDVGIAPGGYAGTIILWATLFFTGNFLTWFSISLDWKEFNSQIDSGTVGKLLKETTDNYNPLHALCVLLFPYFFQSCLALVTLLFAALLTI